MRLLPQLLSLTVILTAVAAEPFWRWFCGYTQNGIDLYKRAAANTTLIHNETTMTTVDTTVPSTTSKFYHRNSPTTVTLSTTTPTAAPETVAREQCTRYDDTQLYSMLQDARAYNQRFMANTVREAAKFPELHVAESVVEMPKLGSAQHVTTSKLRKLTDCDESCQAVEKQLNAALEEYQQAARADVPTQSHGRRVKIISSNAINDDPSNTQSCHLEAFFPIGDCAKRGDEVDSGYARLCTACNGVYKVSAGCFPQFFNAVTCDTNDTTCIYDWWRLNAHGKCQEQKLTFTVMKNLGTPTCQRWEYENLQVPIGCECFLNNSSFLRT